MGTGHLSRGEGALPSGHVQKCPQAQKLSRKARLDCSLLVQLKEKGLSPCQTEAEKAAGCSRAEVQFTQLHDTTNCTAAAGNSPSLYLSTKVNAPCFPRVGEDLRVDSISYSPSASRTEDEGSPEPWMFSFLPHLETGLSHLFPASI